MTAIDNTGVITQVCGGCDCTGFAPSLAYVWDSSAKTIAITDSTAVTSGDKIKTINIQAHDQFGGTVHGSLSIGGKSYTSVPTVAFSGGGGSGAAATAVLTNGVVTGFTITNAGTGYTSAPTVAITGGGGSGAKATAGLTSTTVTSLTLVPGTTVTMNVAALDASRLLKLTATVVTDGGCVADGSVYGVLASGTFGTWDKQVDAAEKLV